MGISLDGFIAGTNRGPNNPLGDVTWMFAQRAFREAHGLESGGETGDDNRLLQGIVDRIGANTQASACSTTAPDHWKQVPRGGGGARA